MVYVVIIAFAAAWLLFLAYLGQLANHIILELHKEYNSPAMGHAIEYLWHFYDMHPDNLAEAYLEAYKAHKTRLENMSSSQTYQALTLHHSRRQVSHFYQHLATLYRLRILAPWIIKKEWNKSDLDIIDKIIIPIEEGMLKDNKFGATSDRKDSIEQLRSFYNKVTSA